MPEIKATAGLNVFVAQFNVILQPDPKKKRQIQVAFDVPWTALSYFRESVKGNPPFVIAVDEAHRLIGSDGLHGTANYILQNLHEGGAVPIIPILAGHVHTPEVIEESISERLAEEQSLFMTNLSKSESRDYVRGVLDHLEADGDFNAIADWIYGESDGFPHHIRGALSSIAKCMLKTNSLRIADLDINAIEQTFSAGRCNYYARRMGEDLPDYDAAVSAALKVAETPKSVSRKTIIQTLKQGIQDMIESGDAPPDPLEARAILKILIRRGAIARTGPTHYTCLIRSLARFADFQTHAPHAPFPAEKPRPRNNGSRPMGVP